MNYSSDTTGQIRKEEYRTGLFRRLKYTAGSCLYFSMGMFGKIIPDRNKPGNILLINVNGIGDVIVSTAALADIRKKFPGKRIAYVTHRGASSALDENPFIDRVYVHAGNKPKDILRYLEFTREFQPEYVVALNPGYKNALLACMAPGSRKIWFLQEDRVVAQVGRNASVERVSTGNISAYANIAASKIGCYAKGDPQIFISNANRIFLDIDGIKPVALFVGGKWPWKQWETGKFAELAANLCKNYPVIVCGGRGDEGVLKEIEALVGRLRIRCLLAENIQQLASIIDQAELLVTTDTVAVHVATAVGSRAVVLFGPTDPDRVLPENTRHVVLSKGLRCQPCYSVGTGKGRCIYKVPSPCLRSITAAEVTAEVQGVLE